MSRNCRASPGRVYDARCALGLRIPDRWGRGDRCRPWRCGLAGRCRFRHLVRRAPACRRSGQGRTGPGPWPGDGAACRGDPVRCRARWCSAWPAGRSWRSCCSAGRPTPLLMATAASGTWTGARDRGVAGGADPAQGSSRVAVAPMYRHGGGAPGAVASISIGRPVLPPLVTSFHDGDTPGVNEPTGSRWGTDSRVGHAPACDCGIPTTSDGLARSMMAARSGGGSRWETGCGTRHPRPRPRTCSPRTRSSWAGRW